MNVCAVTDIGCQRKDNQDSCTFRQIGPDTVLLVVCDGMGGAQAGSVASSVATSAFTESVEQALVGGVPGGRLDRERVLITACREANRRVHTLSLEKPEYEGMGTTLVAALVRPDGVCVANVGDSRCYLMENDSIRQVTVDHSLVQMLVDRGEITPAQARIHPQKNLITRALGVDSHVQCDLSWLEVKPGGRLLLCSDGLTNVLEDDAILALSTQEPDPEGVCRTLLERTLEQGAPDNVTVVLAQL